MTEHFTDEELGVAAALPREKENWQALAERILEPIRAKFGPVRVTCGRRSPEHNAEVGGSGTSEHLGLDDHAACDIQILAGHPPARIDLKPVFDWIRLESGLPFNQVILEYSGGAPACIHISHRRLGANRRQALVGMTYGKGKYQQVAVGMPPASAAATRA